MTPPANQDRSAAAPRLLRREYIPVAVLAAAALVALTVVAPTAWLVLLTDGLYVLALLAAAAGWGCWPVVWLGLRRRPTGQQLCLSMALGLGVLGVLALALGLAGLLTPVVAWILLGLGGVLGLARLQGAQRRNPAPDPRVGTADVALRCLALLPLVVPLVIVLVGALLPPGTLWTAEARGYDALEYHLQAPREYFEQGRIHFLPHNVYASFAQQVETLYLLLMYLTNDPLRAAIPAQLLHAMLGLFTVIALVAWTPTGWPRVLVALVAGAVPWLAYLGCLAYVEMGVLFFAALAGLLVLDHFRRDVQCDWRTTLAAGLCAGLAGGCKYTAIVMVAAGLGTAWLVTMRGSWRARLLRLGIFGIGTAAALSPWLVRNAVLSGNPVYPFGYRWFGGAAWSAEQAAQWSAGHRVPAERDSLAGRARIARDELFRSRLFGPAVWVSAVAAAALWPGRRAWLAAIWLGFILIVWATCTHMPGRFAVPAIVPLALAVSGARIRGAARRRDGEAPAEPPRAERPALRRQRGNPESPLAVGVLVVLAAAGALWNDAALVGLWRGESDWWYRRTASRPVEWLGTPEVFVQAKLINETVRGPNAYAWLVGDAAVFYVRPRMHYTVPFSRDPWLEYAAAGASPQECVDWLRTQKVTHVVFSWSEIDRLRRTYGFSEVVSRAWVARLAACGLRRVAPRGELTEPAPTEIYWVVPQS